ncbi:hypothetical protein GUJ93_ZPchr0004g39831 [Zizania palustris]|uniref:Uncharacterized protein n=1 Tax=Zizania palustris TaxID=103762 RepID=A0A8J5VMV7_ZIZPA|nr:hypothetical protein GUJ93_ZPchr0004g39831 [Zizania palustris]
MAVSNNTEEATTIEASVWGEFFINYEPKPLQRSEQWMVERANKLKEDVSTRLQTCNDLVERMHLVDAIQRLGIDHLFKKDICGILSVINGSEFPSSNLHDVATRFLLLREHGFWVSSDAFKKFRGSDGRFINDVTDDPRGLLSLYNAAHLLVHDEPELEEAIFFARHHLESMIRRGDLNPPLVDQVKRALHVPLTRTYKRVETLHCMLEYEQEEGHIAVLLDLAKMDFNLLQQVHLRELKAISEWSKDLYGHIELNYARDRAVENYATAYILFHEEGLGLTRLIFAKICALIVIMDDTYDSHATIEECRKLNEAIQRWDETAIPLLPDYLKKFYCKILNIFKESEDQLTVNEKYRVSYAKKRVPLLTVAGMLGSGEAVTNEAFQWAASHPSCVIACAKIMRFMNDIAAFKCRKSKGDVASSLECYIDEHQVTSKEAIAKFDSLIEDEWRTLNKARYECSSLLPAVQLVVNIAVAFAFFYDGRKDAYTFTIHFQEVIDNLFVKPIPI